MDSTAPESTRSTRQLFKDLQDPRQRGKVSYPLEEILLLCLLAVLAGAETITDIALFGVKKRDLLRRFRPFRDGTPTHDHLGEKPGIDSTGHHVGRLRGVAPRRARDEDDSGSWPLCGAGIETASADVVTCWRPSVPFHVPSRRRLWAADRPNSTRK